MFVALESTQRDVKIDTSQAVADVVFEEEIIPITETPEEATPPPPEAPKVAELLEIVDDQADIEESTTILNEDNTPKVEVKYVPVQVVRKAGRTDYLRSCRKYAGLPGWTGSIDAVSG